MSDNRSPLDEPLSTPAIPLDNKRIINAWAMFDWANSSYALVIAVAIFPLYFNAEGFLPDGEFLFLGIPVTKTSLFSYAVSISYVIIALLLPILSGIADYSGRKLSFMKLFTLMGSLACISLYFFTADRVVLGVFGFVIATVGFAGGQVFYNSFLPLIASEERYDQVSAKGFAFGYIGSVILLIINLAMIQMPETFGFAPDSTQPILISFVMVGLWWFGFAQITFSRMPKDSRTPIPKGIVRKGFQELQQVFKTILLHRNTKLFLAAFFFYSAGVQTILYLASTFATDELKFEAGDLIVLILILQLVAIVGAFLFARISKWKGNKIAIISMLFIWISICVLAYYVGTIEIDIFGFMFDGKVQFYLIAALVGLVMGGIQSVSRSTYSKLIPENTKDTASFFSFYDVLEKVAIVVGTFSFGIIDQNLGGMRNSILALGIFFIIGLVLLFAVRIKHAKAVA